MQHTATSYRQAKQQIKKTAVGNLASFRKCLKVLFAKTYCNFSTCSNWK
jgi:hypothetical protein